MDKLIPIYLKIKPKLKEKLQAEAEKLKLVNREKSSRASLSGFFSK